MANWMHSERPISSKPCPRHACRPNGLPMQNGSCLWNEDDVIRHRVWNGETDILKGKKENKQLVDCLPGPWGDSCPDITCELICTCAESNNTDALSPDDSNRSSFSKEAGFEAGIFDPTRLPPRIHVLPMSLQMRGLHTLIRNRETGQDAFIFYAERLMRPLFEYALNLLPYEDVVVDTPQSVSYHGRRRVPGTKICGVSILRAGEALEPALCAVCKDVSLGKILIQTNQITQEPELHYLRLPSEIKVNASSCV
ncbi:unnamed protein product [Protopolystoma xenopodis]|uniref:Phosphoribosyltransferase domain-containing protein n=1 Tax=Protopolystoma xenopodis TaxID=117903 RepID=A0A3S4ZTT7_9PLAT|nr:unnamed protein product [Protopolystoma xenopodis]